MKAELVEAVHERSGHLCEAGTPDCIGNAEVIHHRKLRKHGGPDSEGNLLHVCNPCHLYIHANFNEAIEAGWRISAYERVS